MGFIDRLFGREIRSARIKSSDPYLAQFFAMRESGAGVTVTPHAVEGLAVATACIQAIADAVAMLPLKVYRKLGDAGRELVSDHPVARLFDGSVNAHLVAAEWLELIVSHALLRGNAYSEIIRDGRGAPVELIPLHPDLVNVVRIVGSHRIAYDVASPDAGPQRRVMSEDMFHLRDRSDDGIIGRSRLSRARDAFGNAIAAETYASSTFANGASFSGLIIHPTQIGEDAHKRLSESLAAFKGSGNAGKLALLEEDMKFESMSAKPDEAQALESRRFNVDSVCSIFKVPPPVIGHLEGSNYSSLQEVHRMFARNGVQPWLNKIERTVERSLFSEEGRRLHECEFDTDLLLKTSMLERYQSYRLARETGLASANELRRFENLNPRTDAGGSEYLSPLNMKPEQSGKKKED
jgi:HK97 family phage portal protein